MVFVNMRKEINMRKNNLKFLYIILIFISSATIFSEKMLTQNPLITHKYSQSSHRNNTISWRYKLIGDTLYKRLYDYSNECWIGEWIPV